MLAFNSQFVEMRATPKWSALEHLEEGKNWGKFICPVVLWFRPYEPRLNSFFHGGTIAAYAHMVKLDYIYI